MAIVSNKIVTASTSSFIRVHQCFILVANDQYILPQPSQVVKLSWSGSESPLLLKGSELRFDKFTR
jgi:hypothetical protein